MPDTIDLSPTGGVRLPAVDDTIADALDIAVSADEPKKAIGEIVAANPDYTAGWSALGDIAFDAGEIVEAYAYYRVGYHRSLDSLRRNGWRGAGRVPYDHEPNRAFHQATFGLMRTSTAFGDLDEAQRCRLLLLDADPTDPLHARQSQ